jgi:hypothetical protein
VQVIRALKLPTQEVQVSINQPPYVDTLVQANDEPKDFLSGGEALHINREERARIALVAQVSWQLD